MYNLILKITPNFFHNIIITVYNYINYRKRNGKHYPAFKEELKSSLDYNELKNIQEIELFKFIKFAYKNSKFYKELYSGVNVESFKSLDDLRKLPIVNKEQLRKNIKDVYTIKKKSAIISKTGGTTGKPLEVYYTEVDMQRRFAFLDLFREEYGYHLGIKTAWFSGKKILNKKNVQKKIFWKYDFYHKVRYYSTFHCSGENLGFILKDLQSFNPKYLVGFPSNIYDIALYGLNNNIEYTGSVEAVFPTAETITSQMKVVIEKFFKCKMHNQYASSEGAPFIFECNFNNLHVELRSGVFEVLDKNDQPAKDKGRLIITSFSTHGTPLIRYDIGDEIVFNEKVVNCSCGNKNPTIKSINGRISDFIYSPYTGKINLGNISNATKGVKGIVKFQIVQNHIDSIEVFIEKDETYTQKQEKIFLLNLYDRFGELMKINIKYTKIIEKEKSGKFRLVKNNISDRITE
jgi:phenylacetate-CoA ligase